MGFSPRPKARSIVEATSRPKRRDEFGAGAVCDLSNGLEARTAEGMRDMRIEQQRIDGKWRDHCGFFAGRRDRAVAYAGERPRRHGGSGHAPHARRISVS